jgi:hypothetical protein
MHSNLLTPFGAAEQYKLTATEQDADDIPGTAHLGINLEYPFPFLKSFPPIIIEKARLIILFSVFQPKTVLCSSATEVLPKLDAG